MSVHAAAEGRPLVGRKPLGGTSLVAVAMVGSGLLTYAFLVLAARTLGAREYGRIGVLWGAMFIAAIVLFRPIEQTASRAIANRRERGEEVRTVVRAAGAIALAATCAAIVATIAAWPTITSRLFGGDGVLTAMLAAGTAAYGLSYLVRGLVGGACWFAGYSLALLADGAARLLVAAPLVFFASTGLAAAALVAAGLAGAVVPLYIGRARLRKVFDGSGGAIFGLRDAASFAAPAVVIAGADQLLVNGGPVLVAVSGGGAGKAAGVVFAATMLVRAPVYVFQGLASAILPNLTRLHARDDSASFVDAVHRATAVLVGAGAVIVASVAIAGPAAMALYGSDYRASRSALVLLAVGVACYLAAGTFSQALLSVDGGRRAAVAWVAAGAVLITYYASSAGSPLGRVSAAFACAMATLVVLTAGLFAMKVRQR